jgi:predicted  nucleic acid-binding Zn-ribbon protein
VTSLETLLEVQEHDTALDQLKHRRETLPERTQLADIQARMAELDRQIAELATARDEVAVRQERHEGELNAGERRIGDLERKMYSGEVTATRDLMAMTDEVESLRKRCSSLEDLALGAIEEREELEGQMAEIDERRDALGADADEVRTRLEKAQAEIDAEVTGEHAAREGLARGLAAELISEYERLRQRLGGVGAARLVGESCTGCHLTLPATEIDRFRHLDPAVVVHCDQCGRILIRS